MTDGNPFLPGFAELHTDLRGVRLGLVQSLRAPDEPVVAEYTLGAVAMANAGPNTNGSQFFVCIDDCTRKLSKDYNLFGYVTEGIDVAQSIQVGDVMRSVAIDELSQ